MIDPFRLKKEFKTNYRALSLAQEIFGTPVDGFIEEHHSERKCESTWRLLSNGVSINLNISQIFNSNIINITISQNSLPFNVNAHKDHFPDWQDKFKKYIDCISKPWEDWAEEEIVSDPMWIYFFYKSNRDMPEQYHSAMVLFSYKDNKNIYVRKYFDESKEDRSEEARNSC